MSDNVVVSPIDQPNPLRRKPPVPVKEVVQLPTPIYTELADALGHDPLDASDDMKAASELYTEAKTALSKLVKESPWQESVPMSTVAIAALGPPLPPSGRQ